MRILVTGSTGFLGQTLTAELNRRGHEVLGVESRLCDLTDAQALPRFTAGAGSFDRIFHLAAWTQAGDFCLHNPGRQWLINQALNTNVLSWWSREQPQAKLIAIGTSCAYDEHLPYVEDNYLVGQPTPDLLTYAMTKRMLYVGLLSLARQFGLRYLHVVPSTMYGPNYHVDGRQMHFIFDLIRKILRGQKLGSEVVLWGDGHQRRELVHVADFVRILLALDETAENETFNIGTGIDHTIRDFAGIICGLVGFDSSRIVYDTSQYVGARQKRLVNDKLVRLFPDCRFTPLRDGLAETIDWMQERPEILSPAR